MGLATINPHNQKEHTESHKIPTFGVNQLQRFKNVNINKEIYVWDPNTVSDSVRMAIHFFVNFGLQFMTMWINSC